METYYFFKDGTVVCLLHIVSNKYAAEKAMLKTYNKITSDILRTGSKVVGRGCSTFDGINYH